MALHEECRHLVRQIESLVRREQTGSLAELRRLDRVGDGPPPEAFWSLIDRAQVPVVRERFWEALLPMMVTCSHHRSTPKRNTRAGHVLRAAGVTPSRVERWLRLGAGDARVELRKLLRRVDTVDWFDLSRLLDAWDRDAPNAGDEERRSFARDFFLYRPNADAVPVSSSLTSPTV